MKADPDSLIQPNEEVPSGETGEIIASMASLDAFSDIGSVQMLMRKPYVMAGILPVTLENLTKRARYTCSGGLMI